MAVGRFEQAAAIQQLARAATFHDVDLNRLFEQLGGVKKLDGGCVVVRDSKARFGPELDLLVGVVVDVIQDVFVDGFDRPPRHTCERLSAALEGVECEGGRRAERHRAAVGMPRKLSGLRRRLLRPREEFGSGG